MPFLGEKSGASEASDFSSIYERASVNESLRRACLPGSAGASGPEGLSLRPAACGPGTVMPRARWSAFGCAVLVGEGVCAGLARADTHYVFHSGYEDLACAYLSVIEDFLCNGHNKPGVYR